MSMTYLRFRGRLTVFLSTSILLWSIIVLRVFFIQVVDSRELGKVLEERFEEKEILPAFRGNFYDRNGKKLTDNVETCSFAVRPDKVRQPRKIARLFSHFFGKSENYYLKLIQSPKRYVYLEGKIPKEKCRPLLETSLAGLVVEREIHRYYPYGQTAAPLLGYVGVDNEGLTGLEAQFEPYLKGTDGWRIVGIDGRGRKTLRGRPQRQDPINGCDFVLSIDIDMQAILEEELEAALERHKADRAMGILLEPYSGEILAIASLPAFDPNKINPPPPRENLNLYPITAEFEPGSTFKLVGATALLKNRLISADDKIYCENGQYRFAGIRITDWKPFRTLTFAEIIQNSSNIGVIKAISRLKDVQLYDMAREYGFGEKTNITYPGEARGRLRNYTRWSKASRGEVAIGYEVSATALQLTLAYGAVANGGYLMEPVLVKEMRYPDGGHKELDKPQVVRQVADPQTVTTLKYFLQRAVSNGTGHRAYLPGLQVAGKTGTAKKLENGRYVDRYIASFISFFPSDHPLYVLAVMVDNPRRNGYTGGMVAAPVAKAVFKRLYNLYQPQFMAPAENAPPEPVESVAAFPQLLQGEILSSAMVVMPQGKQWTMPDLRGLSLRAALQILSQLQLAVHVHGSGQVFRQIPAPGHKLKPRSDVTLYLSED